MLRSVVWTLRQRRYRALAALMLAIALVCIAAGTFEIHRYQEKRHDNTVLKANANAAPTALTTGLVPLAGHGSASETSIRFRTVRVTGTFLAASEQYVDDQQQDGRSGFYALTPFRSANGIVLVARGFVDSTPTGTRPDVITAPPTGRVTIVGRLRGAQTTSDRFGQLGHQEITAVNAAQQSARLGAPVFDAYLTLNADQPGTTDLDPIPQPDLSNPAGGAGELQLLSYVLQWYVFALLALGTPFLFSRGEAREARLRFLGYDPDDVDFGLEPPRAPAHAELGGSTGVAAEGMVAVRHAGEVAVGSGADPRWERASRLADRYGRSLGRRIIPGAEAAAAPTAASLRRPSWLEPGPVNRTSADAPHRSPDEYHADYNDYLWQLALSDGDLGASGPDDPPPPPQE